MIAYPLEKVIGVLKEISKKFILTQSIELKKIKYIPSKQLYIVTDKEDTQHGIPQELINGYIESFGEKCGLEIAGNLRHSIELEQSIYSESGAGPEEFWNGDMNDVYDYLKQKEDDEDKDKK